MKKILVFFVALGVLCMFNSCKKPVESKNEDSIFNNDILFSYDSQSQLSMDSFKGLSTMTDLNLTYPIKAVRQNGEEYYTIYSLKDRKLAYVVFQNSLNTGVNFYIKNIVEYPSDNADNKLCFLLEKDLPKNILK